MESEERRTEQFRQAIRMYEGDVPVEDIRAKLHIGYTKLYEIVNASGLPMRGGGPHQETDPEKLRQAVEMFKKEITEIELLDGPDEKATPKEIDLFARKQVKGLNTSIQKQVKRGSKGGKDYAKLLAYHFQK